MSIGHELRWASQSVARNRGFSLVVIAILAIGMALNLVIASLVDSLLFRAAPGTHNAGALAVTGKEGSGNGPLSYRDIVDFREQSRTLARLAAWKSLPAYARVGDEAVRVRAILASAGYFEALGVTPAQGRFFGADEDRVPNAAPVVVLTDAFWRSRLGARNVLGEDIGINGRAFRVIGIAPPAFRGTIAVEPVDLFVPMMMQPQLMIASDNLLEKRGWSGVYAVAEPRPGVSAGAVEAELRALAARLAKAYPDTNDGRGVAVMPISRAALAPSARRAAGPIAAVLSIVGFGALFLICANVANLFVGRAIGRAREIAVRAILGGGQRGVARQLALESVLLALCGATAGLALASFALAFLRGRFTPLSAVAITPATAALTLVLAIAAGLACAIVPMLTASESRVQGALRGRAGTTDRGTHRVTKVLVAMQVAVSVVLLVVSALFAVTLANLGRVALGFDTRGVLSAELAVDSRNDDARVRSAYAAVLERVRALPWVEAASLGSVVPLSGEGDQTQARPDGAAPDEAKSVAFLIVAPSYFRTLGIPLSRGREFSDGDTAAAPPVVMINETLARQFWPRGDAAGSRLRLSGQKNALEVVGVVANSRFAGLRDDTPPTIFVVQAQAASLDFADVASSLTLFVRTERDAASAARDLRPLLAQTGVPVGLVQPLEQLHAQAAAQERVMSILIAAVAALALVISALGLYGVLSLSIAQRTQEIGVRMALGATPGEVVRTTMLQGATLALAGFVTGSVLIVAGRNLLTPFLFGTRVGAPGVWAAVIAFLGLTVAAATWLPARRAASVQPAVTLRQQ